MTLGNEFWAAVLGAFVGGTITGIIQLMTLRHINSKEVKRDLEHKQALGRGLIFKLMRIADDLGKINQHLNCSKKSAEPDMLNEPWSYVLPLANLPDPVSIQPDEVALIMGTNNIETVNDLLDLEHIHKSSISVMRKFGKIREKIGRKMSQTSFSGNNATLDLTPEEGSKLRPDMISMNSMVEVIHSRSKSDFDVASKTLRETNRILTEEIDLKLKLEIK